MKKTTSRRKPTTEDNKQPKVHEWKKIAVQEDRRMDTKKTTNGIEDSTMEKMEEDGRKKPDSKEELKKKKQDNMEDREVHEWKKIAIQEDRRMDTKKTTNGIEDSTMEKMEEDGRKKPDSKEELKKKKQDNIEDRSKEKTNEEKIGSEGGKEKVNGRKEKEWNRKMKKNGTSTRCVSKDKNTTTLRGRLNSVNSLIDLQSFLARKKREQDKKMGIGDTNTDEGIATSPSIPDPPTPTRSISETCPSHTRKREDNQMRQKLGQCAISAARQKY